MRKAEVYYKGEVVGLLTQLDDGIFTFRYHDLWVTDKDKPAISLTMPKTTRQVHSDYLFPLFYNMLPEGSNKQVVCKSMRIDETDYFSLLLATAQYDTIGAVTVKKI